MELLIVIYGLIAFGMILIGCLIVTAWIYKIMLDVKEIKRMLKKEKRNENTTR